MQRIGTVTIETAPEKSKPILESINAKFGKVPNIFATIANSPAALKSMMGMFGALEDGALSGLPHEAIALRIGQLNGCPYCTAAHTAKAKMTGASEEQAIGFRKGNAEDSKIQALLKLAEAINEKRGEVSDEELADAVNAGLTEGEMLEALAIVVVNIFTNSLNAFVKTDVDFPPAPELK